VKRTVCLFVLAAAPWLFASDAQSAPNAQPAVALTASNGQSPSANAASSYDRHHRRHRSRHRRHHHTSSQHWPIKSRRGSQAAPPSC